MTVLFDRARMSGLSAAFALAFAAAALAGTPALAQQQQPPPVQSTMEKMTGAGGVQSDWSGRVGLGGILRPEFEGGSETEFTALPFIDVTWRDRVFFNIDDGLGLNIRKTRNLQTAITLGVDFGRDEGDSDELRGLGDIDSSLELGALFEVVNGHWKAHGSIALGITDGHEGIIADLGAKYGARYGRRSTVTFGPTLTVADDEYMSSYFGVDAQQSARSGLAVFEAGMDIKDIALEGRFTHQVGGPWAVSVFGKVALLFGDAADSPVTREDTVSSVGLAVTYGF